MEQIKMRYRYSGPVTSFGEVVCRYWEGETWATSPRKAASNLRYRYKQQHNLSDNAKIELLSMPVTVEDNNTFRKGEKDEKRNIDMSLGE